MQNLRIVRYCVFVLTFLFARLGLAQHSAWPVGLDHRVYGQIPALDIEGDADLDKKESHRSAAGKDPFVAYNYRSSFTPQNSGHWNVFNAEYNTWQLKIRSEGAYGIALVLSNIKLHTGRLYIYNEHGIKGAYTQNKIPASGVLPISFLPGDEVVVEYVVPIHDTPGIFTIEMVSHAYIDPGVGKEVADETGRTAQTCYACLEGDSLQLAKRSVVKIIAHREDGSLLCTGTLINNTAGDQRPYVLTAQHCIASQADANRSIFIFDYDDLCNEVSAIEIHQLQGAALLETSYDHDFTLVELNHHPPAGFRPYYAGWNLSSVPPDHVVSIHHPGGGPKKVSASSGEILTDSYGGDNMRAPEAFWKVLRWDLGVTEGGSSGAPLFNEQYQVIGTLTGGASRCGLPYNDYFQKLASSAQAFHGLMSRLDPLGLEVDDMQGLDPFQGITPVCSTLSNIIPGEPTGLEAYDPGTGYYSGYNSDGITTYAEKFFISDSMMLTGVSFSIGSINTNASGGLLVAVHSVNENGLPGPPLYETPAPYSILSNTAGYVEFYPYVKVKGHFFVSYTLFYSPLDAFAVNQAAWRSNGSNSAYLKLSTGWAPLHQVSPQGRGTSFDIKASVCADTFLLPEKEPASIMFYPNPAMSAVIGKADFSLPETFQLQVFDLQGRLHTTPYQVLDNSILINLSALIPGMYIVRITTGSEGYSARIIKGD